ncbi:putative phage abortive infection protein [Pectobacterium parmentieri]|uniref:putative phage abortive infection protein n=1 Tax=Pectobacterium parmentieri TaxID=1905730 RepID=UPI000EABFD44|nr:putative phage abortive infection protein [Pectobacterium parmentieri]AYH06823.1 hypothetical protein C5E25_16400 [Pectobacterium parmentieri]AYH24342.1 hypothetical protein C5E21_16415 [Pectobacterium parmentieri]MBN3180052.1 hypothetical protein [Pectobacterium parmentieri]
MNRKALAILLFFLALTLIIYTLNNDFIFTLWLNIEPIGSLATALALIATVYSAYLTRKSSEQSEYLSQKASFEQRFTLILEQHNILLASVNRWKESEDTSEGSYKEIISNIKDIPKVLECIRGHLVLSPYMRILYHALKTVNFDYPKNPSGNDDDLFFDKKKYTSLLRSFIPNDILLLIAINSSVIDNGYFKKVVNFNDYRKYQILLNKYNFFEHIIFNDSLKVDINNIADDVKSKIKESVKNKLLNDSEVVFYNREENGYFFDKYIKNNHDEAVSGDYIINYLNDPFFLIEILFNLNGKYMLSSNYGVSNSDFLWQKMHALTKDEMIENIFSELISDRDEYILSIIKNRSEHLSSRDNLSISYGSSSNDLVFVMHQGKFRESMLELMGLIFIKKHISDIDIGDKILEILNTSVYKESKYHPYHNEENHLNKIKELNKLLLIEFGLLVNNINTFESKMVNKDLVKGIIVNKTTNIELMVSEYIKNDASYK